MENLPEEIQNKIIMFSVQNYSYMFELKQVHKLIIDFSEEYEDDRVGLILWFDHARMVRNEPRGQTEHEYYLELIENQCREYRW